MKRNIVTGVVMVAVAVALAVLLYYALPWLFFAPERRLDHTARAMIGRPEAEVVKVLGPPQYVVTAATLAGRTVDYPWGGMHYVPVPNHPVRNRVLLYSKICLAIYLYVDERGIVEFVAAART